MPRQPGVPTLDPVNQPTMSPQEAGRPGEAIAGFGDVGQDDAQLEYRIRAAQEHVDSLAAQNDLAAVYADTQNKLSKTANSRDVGEVIAEGNKELNAVSARWSKSPASVKIQMSADALRPDLARIGTVKQVDLMGKEFKITIDKQAELLAGAYATDRASGGGGDTALSAFTAAVDGGVKTGMVGDVEAQEYIRLFRQRGQELQIKNDITNANPEVNQRIYDQINQHREDFPDVTQEVLDTMKGQALSAFEAHTKQQEWAEGQMAEKTMLRPLIEQHTNPATHQFDPEAARADIAQQFEQGKITPTQEKVLSEGVKAHQADLQGQQDKQATTIQNDILKLMHDHKYTEAYSTLEKVRPWLEQNGEGELYKGLLNYGDSQRRQERAEYNEERSIMRQDAQDESYDTFGKLQTAIASGYVFTDAQILNMAGRGKGKMESPQVAEALKMAHAYQADPTYQSAVNLLANSFPLPTLAKTASTELKARSATESARVSARQAKTFDAWQARVNANPNEDKLVAMQEVLKPAIQQQITEQINAVFGAPNKPLSAVDRIVNFLHPKPASTGPKEGDTKKNSSGDTVVYRGGKWGPA